MKTGRPREFDREKALEAALTLFWQQGYEPTSLSQLKQAMGGISPTSFYAAFGSKEQLFHEVLSRYSACQGRVTDTLHDETGPAKAAIETCLRQSIRMQTDPSHPPGCLIIHGASNCGPDNNPVVELLRAERERNRKAIVSQVRRARLTGEIADTVDVEALAGMFNTFLVGISTAARDGASAEELDGSVDLMMRNWPGI